MAAGKIEGSGRLIPSLALLTAMLLWGSSFVAMKFAFQELHPLLVIFGRMLLAAACFLPFVPSFTRLPLRRHHILPLLAMGFFEPCLYFLLETAALLRTSAAQASMITTMLPLMVAMVAGVFLGERISRLTIVGCIIAAAGAIWLTLAGTATLAAPDPVLGNFLEFLAMVSATGYIILMKYLSRSLPSLFLTAVQSFVGVIFFLPVLFLAAVRLPEHLYPGSLVAVLYLGTMVSVGAYGLYNLGTSRLPASQAAAFINLIPVFTIILGFFILDERLSLWQLLACLVVFVGVLLSQGRETGKQEDGMRSQRGKSDMARYLIIIGVFFIAAGLLWPWLKQIPLGRLPGDIVISRQNFRFYFPVTTSILVSLVLTLLVWLFRK